VKKLILAAALVAFVAALGLSTTGCKHSGSREFIPGRGWVPN
jgi:hypothetical protein